MVFLGEFYVDKSEQGSGILRTVYQRLETDWKNSGFTKGVLNVDLKNTAGILFWIKMGFKTIDVAFDTDAGKKKGTGISPVFLSPITNRPLGSDITMLTDMATVSLVYESCIAVLDIATRYQYDPLLFQMLQPYEGSGNPCGSYRTSLPASAPAATSHILRSHAITMITLGGVRGLH